jgi:hypothetical protein
MRQEGVLLSLVEAMDLINKEESRFSVSLARSTTSRTSFTPASTAESSMNSQSKAAPISLAKVVFPDPGGPHKITEGIRPCPEPT